MKLKAYSVYLIILMTFIFSLVMGGIWYIVSGMILGAIGMLTVAYVIDKRSAE